MNWTTRQTALITARD